MTDKSDRIAVADHSPGTCDDSGSVSTLTLSLIAGIESLVEMFIVRLS